MVTISTQPFQYKIATILASLTWALVQGIIILMSLQEVYLNRLYARIWLIDVNRRLPSAHLDGFDISADQYPPKEWLPANLSLQTLDIHKQIPEELKGKYDIVHVRLFRAVVCNDDPSSILRNLYSMLSW